LVGEEDQEEGCRKTISRSTSFIHSDLAESR
jgi:hypothetical protein